MTWKCLSQISFLARKPHRTRISVHFLQSGRLVAYPSVSLQKTISRRQDSKHRAADRQSGGTGLEINIRSAQTLASHPFPTCRRRCRELTLFGAYWSRAGSMTPADWHRSRSKSAQKPRKSPVNRVISAQKNPACYSFSWRYARKSIAHPRSATFFVRFSAAAATFSAQ